MAKLGDVKKILANITKSVQQKVGGAQLIALKEAEAVHKKRIFVNGQATSLSKIGKYKKKPMYVSIGSFKKRYGGIVKTGGLKPQGNPESKRGTGVSSKFKNGKTKKSMYLKDGYSGLRKATGRPNEFVNLFLSGNQMSAIQIGTAGGGRKVYGFINDEASKLAKHHKKKYKKRIYEISDNEEKVATNAMVREMNEIVNKVLI